MKTSNIAIFIDVENLTHWVKHSGPEYLFDELNEKGSIIVRKAYGNWSSASISSLQISLDRLGFDFSHNFHPIKGKNSADIQLTIDVVECALIHPEIDCFVLATGDSDFSSLFRKLRTLGKEVIGVGPKSPLSKSVESSCSRFIFTDRAIARPKRLTGSGYNKAAALARNTLRSLNGYADCAELKQRMIEIDPNFDEKKHGFSNFRLFLEGISAIRLTPTADTKGVMAYIEMKNSPVVAYDKTQTDLPNRLENKEPTIDMYLRFLRARNWNCVSKSTLIRSYHQIIAFPPSSRQEIESTLFKTFNSQLDSGTIHNCLTIFMKSDLFNLSLRGAAKLPENELWKMDKRRSYIRDIDFSLLSRLLYGIQENKQVVDSKAISSILYGQYSQNELNQLISDASTQLVTLNG